MQRSNAANKDSAAAARCGGAQRGARMLSGGRECEQALGHATTANREVTTAWPAHANTRGQQSDAGFTVGGGCKAGRPCMDCGCCKYDKNLTRCRVELLPVSAHEYVPCFSIRGRCQNGPLVRCPQHRQSQSRTFGGESLTTLPTGRRQGAPRTTAMLGRSESHLLDTQPRIPRCKSYGVSLFGQQPVRAQILAFADGPGHWTDRYSTYIECGGGAYLFSRRGDDGFDHAWTTIGRLGTSSRTPMESDSPGRALHGRDEDGELGSLRYAHRRVGHSAAGDASAHARAGSRALAEAGIEARTEATADVDAGVSRFGRYESVFAPSAKLSHNAFFLCVNKTLVAYGGRARPKRGEAGIRRTQAKPKAWPNLRWTEPRLILPGVHQGCLESRELWRAQGCEFDGRLWVVRFKRRFFLYARANLNETGGARHVQVTSSANGIDGWTPFTPVVLANYSVRWDNNIYFFSVHKHSAYLVSLFPAVLHDGRSGVFSAVSRDGVHWSAPSIVAHSLAASQRTDDHPVGWRLSPLSTYKSLTEREEGATSKQYIAIHIEHQISTIKRQIPFQCVYYFNADRAREHIRAAAMQGAVAMRPSNTQQT